MKLPKLPFRLPELDLSEVFSISRKEALIAAAVTGFVLVAALVIVVITTSVKRNSVSVPAVDKTETSEVKPVQPTDRAFLSDFILLEDRMQESFTGHVYSREPVEKWTPDMIEKYWIEPEEIAAEHLEEEADKIIRDIFADVP